MHEQRIKKEQTCCLTGHRVLPDSQLGQLSSLLDQQLRRFISQGVRYFAAGGAVGFDMLAEKAVLELRKEFPEISLILYLPCPNHIMYWEKEDILDFNPIFCRADKVVYLSDRYTKRSLLARDRRMVEESSFCICYLTKAAGGTKYTVSYCQALGLPIVNLADSLKKGP